MGFACESSSALLFLSIQWWKNRYFVRKQVLQEMPYACDILVPLAWISHWSRIYWFVTSLESSLCSSSSHLRNNSCMRPRCLGARLWSRVLWAPCIPRQRVHGTCCRCQCRSPVNLLKTDTSRLPQRDKNAFSPPPSCTPLADMAFGVFMLFQGNQISALRIKSPHAEHLLVMAFFQVCLVAFTRLLFF